MPTVNVVVFEDDGVWVRPDRLYAIDIIARAGGGGGSYNGHGGGGGGASIARRRVRFSLMPDQVSVSIGRGGLAGTYAEPNGTDGGDTVFDGYMAIKGGTGGRTDGPGRGGIATLTGGEGGRMDHVEESRRKGQRAAFSGYELITGGGGGGSRGYGGGPAGVGRESSAAGPGNPAPSRPTGWQIYASGGGGGGWTTGAIAPGHGGFPSGGGGGGGSSPNWPAGNGADGLLTIVEYILDERI